MRFFCSEEHEAHWRAANPAEEGFIIDFEQSARVCHTVYGGLLEALRVDGGRPIAARSTDPQPNSSL